MFSLHKSPKLVCRRHKSTISALLVNKWNWRGQGHSGYTLQWRSQSSESASCRKQMSSTALQQIRQRATPVSPAGSLSPCLVPIWVTVSGTVSSSICVAYMTAATIHWIATVSFTTKPTTLQIPRCGLRCSLEVSKWKKCAKYKCNCGRNCLAKKNEEKFEGRTPGRYLMTQTDKSSFSS